MDNYIKMGIIGEGSFGKVIHSIQLRSRLFWLVLQ